MALERRRELGVDATGRKKQRLRMAGSEEGGRRACLRRASRLVRKS